MQIQVNLEELRKNKLFVATPMYGGMNHGLYMKSCLDLQTVLKSSSHFSSTNHSSQEQEIIL
jgi:hypothetical protein